MLFAVKDGSTGVRVVDWATKGRCLIKGIVSAGSDLAWSYTCNPPLLAAVDVAGNILVHAIIAKHGNVHSLVCVCPAVLRDLFWILLMQ